MVPKINIRKKGFFLYLAVLTITYLTSSYLGEIFRPLFLFLFILLLFSYFHILITKQTLNFRQEFTTYYPVKGEEFTFRFTIHNSSILPSPRLETRFSFRHLEKALKEESSGFIILPGKTCKTERRVIFRYRGRYSIGIPDFRVYDLPGIFSLDMRPENKVFTVPPRIIPLKNVPFFMEEGTYDFHGEAGGRQAESLLFSGLTEYRPGDSVKKIAWKKYAARGIPVMKITEGASRKEFAIYPDQRRTDRNEEAVLAEEDCLVEVLTACLKYLLDRSIPVEVLLAGKVFFSGSSPDDFDRFYRRTDEIEFSGSGDPADYCLERIQTGNAAGSSLIITHRTAPETMEKTDRARNRGLDISVISCIPGFDPLEKVRWRTYVSGLSRKGNRIKILERPEELDLDS